MSLNTLLPHAAWKRLQRRLHRWLLPAVLGIATAGALAGPPRDRLTLLVPDAADRNAWQIKVWADSAAEEGIRLDVITDSAFLALGTTAASKVAGLVVPDSGHMAASDALVAAIKRYAYTGGKLMLVYDAGVLTDGGFYPLTGNSRFADMVGVDYVFWNNGLGAGTMVGFGPVVGTKARLESLSLPPGKYTPYTPPASLALQTNTTAFVPASAQDPGGQSAMRETMRARSRQLIDEASASVRRMRLRTLRDALGIGIEPTASLRFSRRNLSASRARDQHLYDRWTRPYDDVNASLTADGKSSTELGYTSSAQDASLKVISGYGYGELGYFHYVTTGTFPGTVYLSSPEHGLVAGRRNYGTGQVLFVNMPLGYFKAVGTDSVPLHGFLNLFAREQVGIATMSVQPRGKGGLIYNWHVDDGDDLNTDVKNLLANTKVLSKGPFSIHFTAGPDVIAFGDANGMDLNNNPSSQDLVRRLANVGKYAYSWSRLPVQHELGSHGGWIHDYWGAVANETNAAEMTPLLTQNFEAIERITGRKIREYSSPMGNTPLWSIKWMEQRGVVAAYSVGDGGAGLVRSWRNGERIANKLWTSPVTPNTKYATFEEFEEFGLSDAAVGQWLIDLQSFVVNRRTNRMFYNHPPGAAAHLNPVNALLGRADRLQDKGRFKWYTMTQMADFSQRRVEASWNTSVAWGITTFSATHPTSLSDMTWLLPRDRYTWPVVVAGRGSVEADGKFWVVTADQGTSLKFVSVER